MNYIELNPFCKDVVKLTNDFHAGTVQPDTTYYKSAEPMVLRLDTIRQIRKEATDGTIQLRRIVISDDYHEDIIVSEQDADKIKKILLSDQTDSLQRQIESLSRTIRFLTEILRARLH